MATFQQAYQQIGWGFGLPKFRATEYYKGASTTWGNPIAISCGIRRLSSWAIWLQNYMTFTLGGYNVVTTSKSEGITTTTTVHIGGITYATWAVSFGYPLDPNAPGRLITRLWANGRLIWSNPSGAYSGSIFAAADSPDGFTETIFTFYNGSEDQAQDPLMAADEGPDLTPAYRGQMIIVFDTFPLTDFSNVIPGITAEIVDAKDFVDGGIQATGTISFSGNPNPDSFLQMGGGFVNFVFGPAVAANNEVQVGSSLTATLFNLIAMLQTSADSNLVLMSYTLVGTVLNITAIVEGSAGNAYTLYASSPTNPGVNPRGSSAVREIDSRALVSAPTLSGGGGVIARMALTDELTLLANAQPWSQAGYIDSELVFPDDSLSLFVNDGLLVLENWALVDILTALAQFYGFDFCESAGTIKFFRASNGGSYTVRAIIQESDIYDDGSNSTSSAGGASASAANVSSTSDAGAVLTTRQDQSAIPTLMQVSYYDQTQEYQYNIQRARRQQFPQRSVYTDTSAAFTVPIICSATEAMTGATVALYQNAHQQLVHNFSLPPNYLYLEPGDVIQLDIRGKVYIAKFTYIEVQPDLSMLCTMTNISYGPDYKVSGFAGGVTSIVVALNAPVGGFKNVSTINPITITLSF